MVPLGVVALAFSALVAFAAATEVHQCAGARFEKLSEHVQLSPCKNIPCRLKKGTDQHITIHFEPESDIAVLKNEVYADFLGVPVPFIGVDGQSICDKLFTETDEKASCPVKAGNNLPQPTLGSIISLLVQRSMKHNYRKSPVISSKYHNLYEELMKFRNGGNVIEQLSESQGISPALFARSLLQNIYPGSTLTKKYLKDTTLIEDKDLAYQVFMGVMNDNQYGPYADIIKQSIGLEYELRLERELRLLNITFSNENILRSRGYDKTPDFKLDVPIAVDGFIINWVESKALFGDEENHSGYLKEQLLCYWNRFGPGMVIYWFGYLETLNSTPEANNMFILRTNFPDKASITQYKFNV